jgi:hypothetical protein
MVEDSEKLLLASNLSDLIPRGMADWMVGWVPFNIYAMPTVTVTDSEQERESPQSNSFVE